jgi:hypothetical protein
MFAGSSYGHISLLDLEVVYQQWVVGVAGLRMPLLWLPQYQCLLQLLLPLPGPAAQRQLLHLYWPLQPEFQLLTLLPAAEVPSCDVVLATVASSATLAMLPVSIQLLCDEFHCAGSPAVDELLHCVQK